jgi:dTDP-4-dehydrorhamnose 3,5-epimerase
VATVREPAIADVLLVDLEVWGDDRGAFVETFRREWVPANFDVVQLNRADRRAGSVVGLHYHPTQADYWYVPRGILRMVLHDLRAGSPTEGVTFSLELGDDRPHVGVYIPSGVAHGFAALTDMTLTYAVDRYYDTAEELGVAWDDPEIAADWGVADPVLSDRDRRNPKRAEIAPAHRPRYAGSAA